MGGIIYLFLFAIIIMETPETQAEQHQDGPPPIGLLPLTDTEFPVIRIFPAAASDINTKNSKHPVLSPIPIPKKAISSLTGSK